MRRFSSFSSKAWRVILLRDQSDLTMSSFYRPLFSVLQLDPSSLKNNYLSRSCYSLTPYNELVVSETDTNRISLCSWNLSPAGGEMTKNLYDLHPALLYTDLIHQSKACLGMPEPSWTFQKITNKLTGSRAKPVRLIYPVQGSGELFVLSWLLKTLFPFQLGFLPPIRITWIHIVQ